MTRSQHRLYQLNLIPRFCGCLIRSRPSTRRVLTVQRSKVNFVVLALLLVVAPVSRAAEPVAANKGVAVGSVVSGIVRDAQGVAQMGALVQVVANDSSPAASAFTDLHGRYVISNLVPGRYRVRASAALFVPAMRDNLLLRSGAKAIVDLTLSTLFETTTWLPAERRKADEPGDDWKWTLRSSANRPILRMVEDGEMVAISSSATETTKTYDSGKGAVTGGDGSFGQGGVHNTISFDRGLDDGSDVRVRLEVGSGLGQGRDPQVGRPSTELQAGYQRRMGFDGAIRSVVSYQSHPELIGTGGAPGLDAVQVATAQRMKLGDLAEVEAGSEVQLVHTSDYLVAAHPFLRRSAHPTEAWTVGYRMATSRDLQAFNGLDTVRPELAVAVLVQGRLRTERGIHQEFSVARKAGPGMIAASYYFDNLSSVLVSGGGGIGTADLAGGSSNSAQSAGVLADATTGGFRVLATGFRAQGLNVMLTEPLTSGLWAAFEYATGTGLASDGSTTLTLLNVDRELKPQAAQSATLALKGHVLRSGTNVRAAYRWQPAALVTAVDSYAAFSDQGYLSFFVRQPVNCGRWLPAGLEATIDVTNLLAQGYRPFLSADGRTMYLAQAPRSIQAGLAFNF
jgi:hypothetical protein